MSAVVGAAVYEHAHLALGVIQETLRLEIDPVVRCKARAMEADLELVLERWADGVPAATLMNELKYVMAHRRKLGDVVQ